MYLVNSYPIPLSVKIGDNVELHYIGVTGMSYVHSFNRARSANYHNPFDVEVAVLNDIECRDDKSIHYMQCYSVFT